MTLALNLTLILSLSEAEIALLKGSAAYKTVRAMRHELKEIGVRVMVVQWLGFYNCTCR